MIKYGIIGPGEIARKFATDIQLAEDSTLVAIASRSLEKAQAFADDFDVKLVFDSYEEMVKSKEVDAVYVATPHTFHKEHSILAMRNGKHVICEKPISINSEELEEMIQVAKEEKVLLMEAMWTRFLPSTIHVKKLIESGKFGVVQHVDLAFGFELAENYPEKGRLLNPDLAGGSILDVGIYPVSTMLYLLDKKVEKIEVITDLSFLGVDLDTIVEVHFDDNTTATLHSSISQDLDDTGSIYFPNDEIHMIKFYHCRELHINKEKITTPCLGDGFVDQIEAFTQTVQSGKLENDIMSFDEMRKVIKFLDLIRKEAKIVYPNEKKEYV